MSRLSDDIWPSPKEIADTVRKSINPAMFRKRYADVFTGDKSWKKIKVNKGKTTIGTIARPM